MEKRLIVLVILLLLLAVTGEVQGIICHFDDHATCEGPSIDLPGGLNQESVQDCCIGRNGFAFHFFHGDEDCFECIVIEWLNGTSFEGPEQTESYQFAIGYTKGADSLNAGNRDYTIEATPFGSNESSDFQVAPTSVRVTPFAPAIVQVTFTRDNIAQEPNKTVRLRFTPQFTSPIGEILLDTIDITVIDTDTVTVQFDPVVYTVTEADGAVVRFNIVKLTSTTQNVTVLFSTLPSTATNPADFNGQSNVMVTFGPSDSEQFVSVSVVNDDIVESNEMFTATLTTTGSLVKIGPSNTATAIIIDNDGTRTLHCVNLTRACSPSDVQELSRSVNLSLCTPFSSINVDDITLDNYDEVLRSLSGAVRGATICESEQTTSNLAIVAAVFARIAALINNTIIIEDGAVQGLVNILEDLQQWNEDVLRANLSDIVFSFEKIVSESAQHFAILVDICSRFEDCMPSPIYAPLEALTIIGVVLSLIGIIATIVTLLLFKKLRERDATKFHIQLCIALFCMLIVFVCGINQTRVYGGCVFVSVLIHYFTLVSVMWMGAEAVLMFQKLVIVFTHITTRYIIAVSLVCWLAPIIPVVIPMVVDLSDAVSRDLVVRKSTREVQGFCFISDPAVFFTTFLGPIFVILLFNTVIFIMVIGVLIKHTQNRLSRTKEQMNKKTTIRFLISIAGVMFLFGLTWLFGALTVTGFGDARASNAFQVLFVLLNAFQGFFICLFFCVLSKDARESWLGLLSRACGRYKSKSLQIEYNSSGAKKKSKTSSTNLTNSNRTSAIPSKSDTSGYNVSTAGHSKEKSYTDVPLTSLHADQGRKKPSVDDLSKEEKDSVI